jgi:WD40 repeat protein
MRWCWLLGLVLLLLGSGSALAVPPRPWLVLDGHEKGGVLRVAFSPDGKQVVSCGGDDTIRFWSLPDGKELFRLEERRGGPSSFCFTPDGKSLLTVCNDTITFETVHDHRPTGRLIWWDLATRKRVREQSFNKLLSALCVSPDRKVFAMASHKPDDDGRSVVLRETATGKEIGTLRTSQVFTALAFSADGKRLAAAGWSGRMEIWDVPSQKLLFDFRGDSRMVSLAFSPDGKRLAGIGDADQIVFYDLTNKGRQILRTEYKCGGRRWLLFARGGKWLLAPFGGTFTLLDGQTGVQLEPKMYANHVCLDAAALSPDGTLFVTACSTDGDIKVWKLSDW